MKRKQAWSVLLAGLLAVFSIAEQAVAQTVAAVQDAAPPHRDLIPDVSMGTDAAGASSHQWHTYIWDSLPSEWLQDPAKAALLQAYQENDWKPFFITGRFDLNANGRLLLLRLGTAQQDVIDTRPYKLEELRQQTEKLEGLRLSLQHFDPSYRDAAAGPSDPAPSQSSSPEGAVTITRSSAEPGRVPIPGTDQAKAIEKAYRDLFRISAAIDVQLANNLMRFANEMNPFLKELQAKALSGQYPMDRFLRELEPPSPQYEVLLKALESYRQLAAQVPHQKLITAQKLSIGDSGDAVRDLQQRLQQEGFYNGRITGYFDESTKQGVQRFQLFHNLETDGKVGQQTREFLNLSFQVKGELIAQALKLYRQSRTRQFQKFVWVNIPQFTLEYRNQGKVAAVHRVIVGKASGKKIKLNGRLMGENQTPTLASTIEQVVINPRWYVSDRIRLELNDAIAADPSFLSRNGYVEMASSRYPWGEPRLIQLPGPNNALGRVRFDFPNAYAVYMHDTPNKHLFQRSRRDFSHGCIRVDKAHDLARELLADDQNPAASKTEAYLAGSRETFLRLNEPIPIIIEYLPVVVNEKGELLFVGDPYGWFQESSDRRS